MRGTPPLHLVLFFVVFGALSVPLAKLTFARPAPPPMAPAKETAEATPTVIRLRFAHVPQSVSLKLGGTELLPAAVASHPSGNMETRADLKLPPDGIELVLTAAWPDGTPDTAVTVELEPDGLDTQSQTRWSDSTSLSEPLTYQWKP